MPKPSSSRTKCTNRGLTKVLSLLLLLLIFAAVTRYTLRSQLSEGKNLRAKINQRIFLRKNAGDKNTATLEEKSSMKIADKKTEEKLKLNNPNVKESKIEKDESHSEDRPHLNALLGLDTVLLIICSNRPEYLKRTLDNVLKYHPRKSVPIIVSQDGDNAVVNQVVAEAQETFRTLAPSILFHHMHHTQQVESCRMWPFVTALQAINGYHSLSSHFKWALDRTFNFDFNVDSSAQLDPFDLAQFPKPLPSPVTRVIILEEDLQIAPDFFEFFAATAHMLDTDKELLAISAWNDNGLRNLVQDPKALYRSDFFPGLGWMLNRVVWEELQPKWPEAYWDDWLREPKQRKGRHIIHPEICRTLHFGSNGVSNAQYSTYLDNIKLNEEFVPFTEMDLNYLKRDEWDRGYLDLVQSAPLCPLGGDAANTIKKTCRLTYSYLSENGPDSFGSKADRVGAMNNIKASVPRSAYKGIVSVWSNGVKVHITPLDLH